MFDGINPNTTYRWKRSAPAEAPLGRKILLSPTNTTRSLRVSDVLCLSTITIHGLVLYWLDVEGLDVRPSQRWVQRLLRGMRLSYWKPAKCVKELHGPEQQHANTHPLFVKLCWLMSTCGVGAHRVVNIDETSCRLLPVQQIGWGRRGVKQAPTQRRPRWPSAWTVARWTCWCRSCTPARQTPSCRSSPGRSAPENGWATTTTILQLTPTLDNVLNPSRQGQAWILLWDMAIIHASEATLSAIKAAFPPVVLCFFPPRSTSYLQPCDVAVFTSFKSCIQAQGSATPVPSSTARSTTSS